MRASLLLLGLLAAAGCADERGGNGSYGSTTPRYERVSESPSNLANEVMPVRIGELGRNFAACNGQGEVREQGADGPIPVRAAPFDQARETGRVAPEIPFYICTRSLDQRWLGIVYRRNGQDMPLTRCGVAAPVSARADYDGPCDSGWVASTQVRSISGVYSPADEASSNAVEPK